MTLFISRPSASTGPELDGCSFNMVDKDVGPYALMQSGRMAR